VICNIALEHLPDYRLALTEINRVLAMTSLLWRAIPNGQGFDDASYRWLFLSGGRSIRFTFDCLVEQSIPLFSGFVYLRKPTPELFPNHQDLGRLLSLIPERFFQGASLLINILTRWADKATGSRLSQYGCGLSFRVLTSSWIHSLPISMCAGIAGRVMTPNT